MQQLSLIQYLQKNFKQPLPDDLSLYDINKKNNNGDNSLMFLIDNIKHYQLSTSEWQYILMHSDLTWVNNEMQAAVTKALNKNQKNVVVPSEVLDHLLMHSPAIVKKEKKGQGFIEVNLEKHCFEQLNNLTDNQKKIIVNKMNTDSTITIIATLAGLSCAYDGVNSVREKSLQIWSFMIDENKEKIINTIKMQLLFPNDIILHMSMGGIMQSILESSFITAFIEKKEIEKKINSADIETKIYLNKI